MAQVRIVALTPKLRLLADFGGHGTMPALAERFGVSISTLYGWGRGREDRGGGDRLPARHLPTMLAIAAQCLGSGYSDERIRDLIFAPLGEFEAALRSGGALLFKSLVDAEARRGGFRLFLKPEPTLGLVESDEEAEPQPEFRVARGHWFRLEVSTPLRGPYAVGLQCADFRWGVVPAQADPASGKIRLPGVRPEGGHGHVCEREQVGLHQFFVIQSPKPVPPDILRYFDEGMELDMAGLGRLAAFYSELNRAQRGLFVADLEITAD
jgi:hypothetical protein